MLKFQEAYKICKSWNSFSSRKMRSCPTVIMKGKDTVRCMYIYAVVK